MLSELTACVFSFIFESVVSFVGWAAGGSEARLSLFFLALVAVPEKKAAHFQLGHLKLPQAPIIIGKVSVAFVSLVLSKKSAELKQNWLH